MSDIPKDLRYSPSHEWVRDEGNGVVTLGITDHAQESLGDLVFVELPEVGQSLAVGDEMGVVESVKAASDLFSPISGEVLEVNETLGDTPEAVNSDPYGDGWIAKVKLSIPTELDDLLDADAYTAVAEEEED